jgi:hypothetical protein
MRVIESFKASAAVWPGTVVEDNNLTVQISALRRILDAAQSGQSFIQTVAYRRHQAESRGSRPTKADAGQRPLRRACVAPFSAL